MLTQVYLILVIFVPTSYQHTSNNQAGRILQLVSHPSEHRAVMKYRMVMVFPYLSISYVGYVKTCFGQEVLWQRSFSNIMGHSPLDIKYTWVSSWHCRPRICSKLIQFKPLWVWESATKCQHCATNVGAANAQVAQQTCQPISSWFAIFLPKALAWVRTARNKISVTTRRMGQPRRMVCASERDALIREQNLHMRVNSSHFARFA